ncbi:RNA methyltransferase [Undibacterium cyanobacteriorum]|uniref:tRNA (cytidine/uridine-2'-O-)-methyltransferase TrmJ n=1 Tax=Undibacterium cyanobacteriorum TaxID=3073561 RepID=A0ABY9RDF7_9BURK|nr:RNA methyltransferase [Undibacterium sp. 20NA77.5]WMW79006.1 RNA methyltransferase [Undibacterium sp. 20NA77.5]
MVEAVINAEFQNAENKDEWFRNLRFVLVETSHPGNIGSAARAIKTMGFGQLVLVNPRFDNALTHPDAVALASGANDVLESALIVDSVSEALHGCNLVAAVSARLREFSPPVVAPRKFVSEMLNGDYDRAAIIFGNEKYGLPNDIVLNSQVLINIPANPEYSSLNLAQAIQVLAYEARMGIIEGQGENRERSSIGFRGQIASAEQVEGMFEHFQTALVHLGFLDPENPKKLMSRLKRLFARTQLETEEVNIMRGISKKILDRTP